MVHMVVGLSLPRVHQYLGIHESPSLRAWLVLALTCLGQRGVRGAARSVALVLLGCLLPDFLVGFLPRLHLTQC